MALLRSVLAAVSLDLKALSSSQAAQPAVTSVLGDLKASMGPAHMCMHGGTPR